MQIPIIDRLRGRPTREQYAARAIDALLGAGETRVVEFDRQAFALCLEERRQTRRLDLSRTYPEYCAAKRAGRQEVLAALTGAWFANRIEVPGALADAAASLLPVVRSRFSFEALRLEDALAGMDHPPFAARVFAEHLAVGLAYDLPEGAVSITQEHLDRWGLDLDAALETARRNLLARPLEFSAGMAQGLHVAACRDGHDASRLVLIEELRNLAVVGDVVGMIPDRDTLLVTGTAETDGLVEMAALAEARLKETGRPVSGQAFRLHGQCWAPWLPPAGHPLYRRFRLLQARDEIMVYNRQQELLQELYQKRGQQVFFASLKPAGELGDEARDGDAWTYCVWTEGIVSYLPRADRVVFYTLAHQELDKAEERVKRQSKLEPPSIVSWERMMEVAGNLAAPQGMYPERYRGEAFPRREQIAVMKQRPGEGPRSQRHYAPDRFRDRERGR